MKDLVLAATRVASIATAGNVTIEPPALGGAITDLVRVVARRRHIEEARLNLITAKNDLDAAGVPIPRPLIDLIDHLDALLAGEKQP